MRSSTPKTLLLCSRQSGKSTVAAALALRVAFLEAPALVLLLSPTQRQSGELFRDKIKRLYNDLGRPVATVQESALSMELANGSRIVSLPGDEKTIRGYSGVNLLVIDEAAQVPDALYFCVRPMLAVSKGKLAALSTPFGRRGWFHQEWTGTSNWEKVKITADQCPRITAEFLEEEKMSLGERWYRQEYFCSFEDVIDAVFSSDDIAAALSDDIPALYIP
jgi:phage terminase large subunit-like protein